jgi:two-component sensor histidine kinase
MELPNLDNLAAAPVRTGAGVIANDAPHDPRSGGLPNGHPLIRCFLGLPLRFAGRLVGVAGVANREGGYDEAEAEFLDPLCSTCGALIEAWRLEHHRRETDRLLRQELERNETLVREAHHRVKNNLQVITSLIRLQMRQSEHEKVVDALKDCEARVRAVALIHDDLAHRNERSVMDLGAYLDRLARSLKQVYGPGMVLRTELAASGASLEESKALPLGLVVSELLANAYKHAVPRGASGVVLKAVLADNEAVVTVADDGPGMAPGESWLGADSLGLPIVRELVERQLEGSLEVCAENGLEVTIRLRTMVGPDAQHVAPESSG